jgi:hypothetical protein
MPWINVPPAEFEQVLSIQGYAFRPFSEVDRKSGSFAFVYGLLPVSERFRFRYQTRMYIRLVTAVPRLSKLYAIQVQEIVSGPLIRFNGDALVPSVVGRFALRHYSGGMYGSGVPLAIGGCCFSETTCSSNCTSATLVTHVFGNSTLSLSCGSFMRL